MESAYPTGTIYPLMSVLQGVSIGTLSHTMNLIEVAPTDARVGMAPKHHAARFYLIVII